MILRIKQRIPGRQPKVEIRLTASRYWFALGAALGAVALAGQPPPGSPPQSPATTNAPGVATPGVATPGAGMPNDEFIEFLGADDVGDTALWEFLKNSAPRKVRLPVPPPQDATQ
jgi:hypothetical protein